jgi:SAM-dependent methyltransferase
MDSKAPQAEAFLRGEGDAWYHRNRHKKKVDSVTPAIIRLGIQATEIVEFGCSDGWRSDNLHELFPEAHYLGIDPSFDAIEAARENHTKPRVEFLQGTVDFPRTHAADLLIYGFCLYLVDRHLLFRVALEADDMLREGGHIIIHDFDASRPHKVPYEHKDGLFSYKMNCARLWLGNPAYRCIDKTHPNVDTAVWVLRKDTNKGWPDL